jgi:hypothetical protein
MPGPPSGLNELRCPERCGDGIGIAGAREDIHGGVGELDDVRVAVLDRPREDLPYCLLAGLPAGQGLPSGSPVGKPVRQLGKVARVIAVRSCGDVGPSG